MFKRIASTATLLLLAACAGKVEYLRPNVGVPIANTRAVDMSRDELWSRLIPELGKRFFVINNLDKASGLINISYTGDPEQYVDCGHITSYVKNAAGERTYSFPAASAAQRYEVMPEGRGLLSVDRRMTLEGRMNLIVEDVGPGKSRLTANTRYVLTREVHVTQASNQASRTFRDSLSFNTGQIAAFPGDADRTIECYPTGRFEEDVISSLK